MRLMGEREERRKSHRDTTSEVLALRAERKEANEALHGNVGLGSTYDGPREDPVAISALGKCIASSQGET